MQNESIYNAFRVQRDEYCLANSNGHSLQKYSLQDVWCLTFALAIHSSSSGLFIRKDISLSGISYNNSLRMFWPQIGHFPTPSCIHNCLNYLWLKLYHWMLTCDLYTKICNCLKYFNCSWQTDLDYCRPGCFLLLDTWSHLWYIYIKKNTIPILMHHMRISIN
jgi:hypothetical protein